MNAYFEPLTDFPDRAGYSGSERRVCRFLTDEGIRGRFLALDELKELERNAPQEKHISHGGAALECLNVALDRPVCLHDSRRRLKSKREIDEPLFRRLVEQCTDEALRYYLRHCGAMGNISGMWNLLMAEGSSILPDQPLPKKVEKLLLIGSGLNIRGSAASLDLVPFQMVRQCRPGFRVEPDCADALLYTIVFLRYAAVISNGTTPLIEELIDCWKALSPEPRSLAPLNEFAGHIRDSNFVDELRSKLL